MEFWATAKINLFMSVLDRRPDGYHNVETVYQSIGLADCLRFRVAPAGVHLECDRGDLSVGPDNLVVRAVELMRRHYPERVKGLQVTLEKRVPVGSGLGGGSADAAATLRACNEIFALGLDAEALRLLASRLGMDVPFLVEGGRAIGRGRGEQLEALEMREPAWVVVVVPDLAISTQWAYERLDWARRVGDPSAGCATPDLGAFVDRLQNEPVAIWARHCYNAFESVVFPAHPQLEQLRDGLIQAGCAGAFLTGSGAAVVGVTDDRKRAAAVARKMACQTRFAEAVPFLRGADLARARE